MSENKNKEVLLSQEFNDIYNLKKASVVVLIECNNRSYF